MIVFFLIQRNCEIKNRERRPATLNPRNSDFWAQTVVVTSELKSHVEMVSVVKLDLATQIWTRGVNVADDQIHLQFFKQWPSHPSHQLQIS